MLIFYIWQVTKCHPGVQPLTPHPSSYDSLPSCLAVHFTVLWLLKQQQWLVLAERTMKQTWWHEQKGGRREHETLGDPCSVPDTSSAPTQPARVTHHPLPAQLYLPHPSLAQLIPPSSATQATCLTPHLDLQRWHIPFPCHKDWHNCWWMGIVSLLIGNPVASHPRCLQILRSVIAHANNLSSDCMSTFLVSVSSW